MIFSSKYIFNIPEINTIIYKYIENMKYSKIVNELHQVYRNVTKFFKLDFTPSEVKNNIECLKFFDMLINN